MLAVSDKIEDDEIDAKQKVFFSFFHQLGFQSEQKFLEIEQFFVVYDEDEVDMQ